MIIIGKFSYGTLKKTVNRIVFFQLLIDAQESFVFKTITCPNFKSRNFLKFFNCKTININSIYIIAHAEYP